jgi:hypothetical protein
MACLDSIPRRPSTPTDEANGQHKGCENYLGVTPYITHLFIFYFIDNVICALCNCNNNITCYGVILFYYYVTSFNYNYYKNTTRNIILTIEHQVQLARRSQNVATCIQRVASRITVPITSDILLTTPQTPTYKYTLYN